MDLNGVLGKPCPAVDEHRHHDDDDETDQAVSAAADDLRSASEEYKLWEV